MPQQLVYVHGAGPQKPDLILKHDIDMRVFGKDMSTTRLAYHANVRWPPSGGVAGPAITSRARPLTLHRARALSRRVAGSFAAGAVDHLADPVGASALGLGLLIAPRSSLSDPCLARSLECRGLAHVPGLHTHPGNSVEAAQVLRNGTLVDPHELGGFGGPGRSAFRELDDQCPIAVCLDRATAGVSKPRPNIVGRSGGGHDHEVLGHRSHVLPDQGLLGG